MSVATAIVLAVLVLQLVVIFGFILLERRQPIATLAWIMAVMLTPLIGALLYFIFGFGRTIRRGQRARLIAAQVREVVDAFNIRRESDRLDSDEDDAIEDRTEALAELGARAGDSPATHDNAVEILRNARATYRAIVDAINHAHDHVHVLFYIIQPDETGTALRDLLVRKANEGLDVRVLADAIGSLRLPGDFWRPLTDAGGRAAWFNPVRIAPRVRRRDRINHRNHRKIVVVDGRVGLTGGINVGREYLGLDPQIGAWRDTHLRLEGPAVLSLQQTFVEDWLHSTNELLDDARYFPTPPAEPVGSTLVQVVASGPDRPWSLIHRLFYLAITHAKERVWITSPYFVPDRVIQTAISTAALRGVDVRLLLPKRSDSRLVDLASRSYYGELLDAGVRIHLYRRGFLHAKTLVVDNWVGGLGSANMDIRSFHLNYELNVLAFGEPFTAELARQFEDDLTHAVEIPRDWASTLSYPKRIAHAFAGLLSPVL